MSGLPIDFDLAWNSIPAFLKGAMMTIMLTSLALILGAILAMPITAARMSAWRIYSWPAAAFVIFFRGSPVLILLYVVYYGFGQIKSLRDGPLWMLFGSAFSCAVIGLTLNHTAYLVEIARGSLMAVPAGLVEACNSLGLSRRDAMIWIRLPLALRYGLKAYQNEVIIFMKGTAVVSVVTVTDLMAVANEIFEVTYDPLTPMLSAAVFYWVLVNATRHVFNWLNQYLNRHNRSRQPATTEPKVASIAGVGFQDRAVPVALKLNDGDR